MKCGLLMSFSLSSTLFVFGQEIKHHNFSQRLSLKNLQVLHSLQKNNLSDTSKICICCKQRGDTSELPLFVLKNIASTHHFKQFILNPKTIVSLNILKPKDAINQFGEQAKFGAVIFELQKNTQLHTLSELFNYFAIKSFAQNLPVCLDDDFITEPSKILADISAVKNMKVIKGKYWLYTQQINSAQNYINIITK